MSEVKCACHIVFPDGTKVAIKDSTARQLIAELRADINNMSGGDTSFSEKILELERELLSTNGAMESISAGLSEVAGNVDNKMDKVENTSGLEKVITISPNSSNVNLRIYKETHTASDNYDSIPFRKSVNDSKHPGTFEVNHPEMVEGNPGYSSKHPVTVGALKNYVSSNVPSYDEATHETAGLMSPGDKEKLDSITPGASGSGTTYGEATSTTAGLMSANDKEKLDSIGLVTMLSDGLMSYHDKQKLDLIDDGANNYDLDSDGMFEEVINLEEDYLSESGTSYAKRLITKAEADKLAGIEAGATANTATATHSSNGLLSADDKKKLDLIPSGSNVAVPEATATTAGLMSASDKKKLDSVSTYNRMYNTWVNIMATFDNGSKSFDLYFNMNMPSKYEKDYNAASTFLAELSEFEQMSFVGVGRLTYTTNPDPNPDNPTVHICDILRLQVYDGKLKIEYYDRTLNEILWTDAINSYITTNSISKSV